jgi:hypothetical protein
MILQGDPAATDDGKIQGAHALILGASMKLRDAKASASEIHFALPCVAT